MKAIFRAIFTHSFLPSPPPVFFAKGYPLRYTIAFVFTLLTVASGVALIGFNYVSNRHATIVTTHGLLKRIGRQVGLQVGESIERNARFWASSTFHRKPSTRMTWTLKNGSVWLSISWRFCAITAALRP